MSKSPMASKQTKRQWKGRKRPNRITRGKEGYRFSDAQRDPEMLHLVEMINEDSRSIAEIANDAYVSPITLYNWVDGKTCKPQNVTITFAARALNLRRAFVNARGTVKVIPIWEDRIQAMKDKFAELDRKEKK